MNCTNRTVGTVELLLFLERRHFSRTSAIPVSVQIINVIVTNVLDQIQNNLSKQVSIELFRKI